MTNKFSNTTTDYLDWNQAMNLVRKLYDDKNYSMSLLVSFDAFGGLRISDIPSGIIICHNHPSGNIQPSESDLAITRKIKESGNVMDIQLLDHLIIVPEDKYFSMGDKGFI